MNYLTNLIKLKNNLKEFYQAIKPLLDAWDDDSKVAVISVLLQNMQFSGKGCENYSYQKELEQFQKLNKALKALAGYEKYHLFNYINETVQQIIFTIEVEEDMQGI